MNIKKRLSLNAFISIFMSLILLILVLVSSFDVNKELNKSEIGSELVKDITILISLTNEYINRHNSRSEEQMKIKIDNILITIKENSSIKNIQNMLRPLELLKVYTSRLVNEHNKKHIILNSFHTESDIIRISNFENILTQQIHVNTLEILNLGFSITIESEKAIRRIEFYKNLSLILFTLVIIVISTFNSINLISKITNPLVNLMNEVRHIRSGNDNKTIEFSSNSKSLKHTDELTTLATDFNEMTTQLSETFKSLNNEMILRQETEELLRQSQKMEAIGQLAGGIAHDLNNVLSAIMGAAEILILPQNGLNENNIRYVEMITKSAIRASDLIKKLLAFSRKGNIITSELNINYILFDLVEIFKGKIDNKITILVNTNATKSQFIGDQSAILTALENLVINASHAMPSGGELLISTRNITLDQNYCNSNQFKIKPGDFLEIQVIDTGCGIHKENLNKIFDPFFTTMEQGKGSGLGLSAVYGTIQDHNGSIEVESEIGNGTTFHILLPCSMNVTQK